jgi:hypothetical protein
VDATLTYQLTIESGHPVLPQGTLIDAGNPFRVNGTGLYGGWSGEIVSTGGPTPVQASGSGDPYITPFVGRCYKLPGICCLYRLFQCEDVIINVSVCVLSDSDKKRLQSATRNLAYLDGYYFEWFYIRCARGWALFDRNISLVSSTLPRGVIRADRGTCWESCPIQGRQQYTYTRLRLSATLVCDLRRYANPSVTNGVSVQLHHPHVSLLERCDGLLASNRHPKRSKIRSLTQQRPLRHDTTKVKWNKTYNRAFNDMFLQCRQA